MKKTLNPVFAAKDATLDFPIYLSFVDRLGALELVIWDKDILTKDYLGEVALGIDDWFKDGSAKGFFDSRVEVCFYPSVNKMLRLNVSLTAVLG